MEWVVTLTALAQAVSLDSPFCLREQLFHFKAILWEASILLLLPLDLQKPALLQYYCTPIAQYTPPYRPPPPDVIHQTILMMAISCDQFSVRVCSCPLCIINRL